MIHFVFFAFNPPEAFSCGAGSSQAKRQGVGGGGGAAIIRFAVTAPLERFRFRVERGVCSLKQAGVGGAQPPICRVSKSPMGCMISFIFFRLFRVEWGVVCSL